MEKKSPGLGLARYSGHLSIALLLHSLIEAQYKGRSLFILLFVYTFPQFFFPFTFNLKPTMLALSLSVAKILVIAILLASLVTAVNISDSLSSYLVVRPISITSADLIKALIDLSKLSTKVLPLIVVNAARSRCPASCDESGLDKTKWTVYHNVNRLS